MPTTAIETTFRCCRCQEDKPVREKALFRDTYCSTCFDLDFFVCRECGRLVRRNPLLSGQEICNLCRREEDNPDDWVPTPLKHSTTTYNRIKSRRKFGVEIETSCCNGFRSLYKNTVFGSKFDGTISGKEFDSPVLYGDAGFEEIDKLLDFAERHGWSAYRECGCHTHYDLRDHTPEEIVNLAYAYRHTQTMWNRLVPTYRRNGDWAGNLDWSRSDWRDYKNSYGINQTLRWLTQGNRYTFVNFTSYQHHNTVEVRILEGTVDPVTICNWIKGNCYFIDAVTKMSHDEINRHFGSRVETYLTGLYALFGDDTELVEWFKQRREACRSRQ